MNKQRQTRAEYLLSALSRLKPWESEGISRRTWERRRRDASPACAASPPAVAGPCSAPEPVASPHVQSVSRDASVMVAGQPVASMSPVVNVSPPEPPPPRAWWLEPLPDWEAGYLEMRNICRDETTIIRFDGQAVKRRQDPERVATPWWSD